MVASTGTQWVDQRAASTAKSRVVKLVALLAVGVVVSSCKRMALVNFVSCVKDLFA